MTRKETVEQKTARLDQARAAASEALFDKYEKWNDRSFLDTENLAGRCESHKDKHCPTCKTSKKKGRKR